MMSALRQTAKPDRSSKYSRKETNEAKTVDGKCHDPFMNSNQDARLFEQE
jgi:hypothetical protein